MVKQCHDAGLPAPAWKSDPKLGVTVVFRAPEVTPEVTKLIRLLNGEMLRRDLQAAMDLKNDEHFQIAYLLPSLNAGLIAMTIPDKPNSSKQRYRLTPLGKAVLDSRQATVRDSRHSIGPCNFPGSFAR
jgi:ATP-dependent DNA helicase RecG